MPGALRQVPSERRMCSCGPRFARQACDSPRRQSWHRQSHSAGIGPRSVDVAIVARNKADLEATARELAAETNRRILSLAADVTSTEQVDRVVARANFRAFHLVQ